MSVIVTIDFWGTLVQSSPLFVSEKIKFTKKYFGELNNEFILKCYSDTKKELNAIIEATGWQPEENLIFTLLWSKLNEGYASWDPKHLQEFIKQYQELAIECPPLIYSVDTKRYLEMMKKSGIDIILSSNTMFINGPSIMNILDSLQIEKYFRSFYFSNVEKISKPNRKMFNGFSIHIGDNPITDGAAPRHFIINSNNKTIKDAYDFIIQNRNI